MGKITRASLLIILLVALFVQTAFAEVQPPKLNQVQQDGSLLQMYVSLTNELGDPVVHGFSPNQFNIRMDDTTQLSVDAAVPFVETGLGVHYVFAVDVSKPVNRMMPDVRSGMLAFMDSLNENDAVSILTFGTDVKTLASHSTDKTAVKDIIKNLSATEMDTVLYKGTYDAVRQAAKYGGRSAVIVITDGKDDPGQNNVEIQQKYTKESIFESVKSAQVPLYCIGLTDNNDVDAESLAEFAQVTGGDQYLVPASQTINKLNTIEDLASNVVVLASVLTNEHGKMETAERHAFRVNFNGVDSNALEDNFYLNGALMKRELMDYGGKVSMVCKDPMQIYAVFDGMGGGEYGEEAAYMAAKSLKEYHEKSEHPDNEDYLRRFLTKTSKEIDAISTGNGLKSGTCGSTAAILILGDWWFRTAHVGDSRIYLLREKNFTRITKDQSEVQRMVDNGQITPEMAFVHPRKNVITHHLGMPLKSDELESVVSIRRPLNVGDWFLICSDGVSDGLRDIEILKLINTDESPEDNANRLVKCAFNKASDHKTESDNLTAILIKVCGVNAVDEQDKRVRKLRLKKAILTGLTAVFGLGAIATLVQIIQFFR